MVDVERALHVAGATISFLTVVYGLVVYATVPEMGFDDVIAPLFLVVPGIVFAAKALGR